MQGKRPKWKAAFEQFIEKNFEQPKSFFEEVSSYLDKLYVSGSPTINESKLIYASLTYDSWGQFYRDEERVRRLESGATKWICDLLDDDGADAPKVEVKASLSGSGTPWVELEISVAFHLF